MSSKSSQQSQSSHDNMHFKHKQHSEACRIGDRWRSIFKQQGQEVYFRSTLCSTAECQSGPVERRTEQLHRTISTHTTTYGTRTASKQEYVLDS